MAKKTMVVTMVEEKMDAVPPVIPNTQSSFQMFYDFGKNNRLVGNSRETHPCTHTDKIVETPGIIKEEVKNKIKSQAGKSKSSHHTRHC